jgi:2-haloacid dehalogenase
MSSNKDIVLAFDAYGTLLSTESIAKKLAEHFGPEQFEQEKAKGIAAKWRLYQLEYTWRLNSMGTSKAFKPDGSCPPHA